jgi:very-short-patch-repair endonuclease
MEPYQKSLKKHARVLRSTMTDAEQTLWSRLRRKQVCGLPFYRQKPLLSYIVDFYSPRAKLVIELDGGQHLDPEYMEMDRKRDRALSALGLRVMRFTNLQVLQEMDGVMAMIYQACSNFSPESRS